MLEGESMLALSSEKPESPKGLLSNLLGLKAGLKEGQDDKFSLLLKSFSLLKPDGKNLEKAELPVEDVDTLLLLDEPTEASSKNSTTKLLSLFALGQEEASDEEQLNPDLLKALPLKDAKVNLQTLIGEAKSYLKEQLSAKIDTKELPKTLGGLIKLAEKSGIDIKAINFESLPKVAFSQELSQALQQAKSPSALPLSTSELVKPSSVKAQKQSEPKPLNALLARADALSQKASEVASSTVSIQEPILDALEKPKTDKGLSSSIQTLLHGENQSQETEGELGNRLEGLKDQEKPQVLTQSKNEALTQKITEAKQLIQHVSQSVKESVENYKPPFTRIKMQLNPQKFGEMDVTLVQRGSNVHININANSTALTVMMQNAHELKTQLSAQGLGDASMNFSSHQQEQHQQRQRQEQAGLAYENFQDFEDEFNEVATALEIVVPRYI